LELSYICQIARATIATLLTYMVDFFFRRKGVLAAAVHILTYLLATPGYSQLTGETVSIIDTLGYRLRMSRNSEDSVNALNKCANDLNREGQVNGKDYAEKALEIAIRTGFIKGRADAYANLAWFEIYIKNNSTNGQDYYQKAASSYEACKDYDTYGRMLIGLSSINLQSNRPETALEYALQAEEVLETNRGYSNEGFAYEMIGAIYYYKEKYTVALDYFTKARVTYERGEKWQLIIQVYNSLTETWLKLANAEMALQSARMALKIAKDHHLKLGEQSAVISMIRAFNGLKQSDSALVYTNYPKVFDREPFNYVLFTLSYERGVAYFNKGDLKNARNSFQDALERSKGVAELFEVSTVWLRLADIAKQENNFREGYSYMSRYVAMTDSLTSRKNKFTIEDIENRYLQQKKQSENDMLKMEIDMREAKARFERAVLAFTIVIAALGIFAAITMYRSRKIIRTKNKLLNEQFHEIQTQNKEILAQHEEIIMQSEQLKSKNEYLEELNIEKDGLMSIVAHDLRAPLNRTKGLAGLLNTRSMAAEDKVYLEKIIHVSNQGLNLIKDILEISSVQYENRNLRPDLIALKSFVEDELLRQYYDHANSKSIQLSCAIEEKLSIFTDPFDLRRILENLISNAIKFSPMGSKVFIRASRSDDLIHIGVLDEGPGISLEDQQKMFRKFQRLSARPTGGENSTGLGLAIVKALVERLHGRIFIDSEVGAGTEFIVMLPADATIKIVD
jgi:signal transduction histidine kinase